MKKLKTLKQKLQGLTGKGTIAQQEEGIIAQLKLMGFEAVETYNPNKRTIYINYKKNIVVKFPNIYSDDSSLDEIPKYACPTEIIRLGYLRGCFIQPLINDDTGDIREHSNYVNFLGKLWDCDGLRDTHVGNIGIYRKKLIIHDW